MKNANDITEQDARRFRMALLRAKLTRMAVGFEENADEEMLERLVVYAERQQAGRQRAGRVTAGSAGSAEKEATGTGAGRGCRCCRQCKED
ncbi:hypothetical protein N1030_17560 [Desulfovibrio mangrovi]|uniref:hypothetical protein n=1 Tax=Desulfovibrio mangrovi TaxID=2976983 RepID=UPI00224787E5|nr:hypothetical protein [Desulfovibrio mangrovi]UZP67380.1 hypothetical protein N1030_17560 [Desulfovibrio mangrovi]